ncbi:hypothetical protein PR003_g16283 [Phytophthora rubi]|uniref:Uncharacterized protein n=1 Tax=Phytophthora rubi TaxID=129364 RepID=A0A6A4EHN8_9STRA|nr:hypothetical protein PR003_g16283 [Phytophthora rubi]
MTGELTFNTIWSRLKARGWRHQNHGIELETRYYTPRGWQSRKATRRGTDYFLGETELLQNVSESKIDAPNPKRQKQKPQHRSDAPAPIATAARAVHDLGASSPTTNVSTASLRLASAVQVPAPVEVQQPVSVCLHNTPTLARVPATVFM